MMGKGYYDSFSVTPLKINGVTRQVTIHGGSFCIDSENIDFMTWKRNVETGLFWVKLHTKSGKEVRVKSSSEGLDRLLMIIGNAGVKYQYGDYNELEYD
mgnify:CR=1 FL=1|tara:strand:- start:748 stop:1044 length:297 start_codon:yes stop_codon:yes gene_type:complete